MANAENLDVSNDSSSAVSAPEMAETGNATASMQEPSNEDTAGQLSVSVPNLSEQQQFDAAHLFESFATVARRNLSLSNARNATDDLMRLMFSNGQLNPGQLLSSAQSFPSLQQNVSALPQTSSGNTRSTAGCNHHMAAFSQALTCSLAESDNDLLDMSRARNLLAEFDDDDLAAMDEEDQEDDCPSHEDYGIKPLINCA